ILAVVYLKETSTIPNRPGRPGHQQSGVDFWCTVEFSRNGRFLRKPSQVFLRALPFGVSDTIRTVSAELIG
ncbi:hypothetical protein, partial [Streptomyces marinisediminis]|uniref:hypothetical protein n=1 Tax=Streptomyces marinisediminis TaxID=2984864 RepID=UPI0022492F84